MQLQPQEFFTIVRQLADHSDVSTNYVRAVIRNARTDELLSTVSLTDKGSQRFTGEYQVPADVSGLGFYLSIVTLVYTDSGYTTLNSAYSAEEHTYLVQDRTRLAGGGRGGAQVDYKLIGRMIESAVKSIVIPETDLATFRIVLIKEMQQMYDDWYADYEKELSGFKEEVLSAISSIEMPEMEKLDLSPVMSKMSESERSMQKMHAGMKDSREEMAKMRQELFDKVTDVIERFSGKLNTFLASISKEIRTVQFAAAEPGKLKESLLAAFNESFDAARGPVEKKLTPEERAAKLLK